MRGERTRSLWHFATGGLGKLPPPNPCRSHLRLLEADASPARLTVDLQLAFSPFMLCAVVVVVGGRVVHFFTQGTQNEINQLVHANPAMCVSSPPGDA
jgi:hypothetical protein